MEEIFERLRGKIVKRKRKGGCLRKERKGLVDRIKEGMRENGRRKIIDEIEVELIGEENIDLLKKIKKIEIGK